MSLRRFLNVAFAILVEEHQRMGTDLITALEKLGELMEGGGEKRAPAPAVQAAGNQQAMEMLQQRLGGVQGAPKPRRGRK